MISTTIDIGSGNNGRFIWWNAGPCDRKVMDEVLGGRKSNLMNRSTALANLKLTLESAVSSMRLKNRGQPIKFEGLKSGVRGFELYRVIKGETQNEHQFLFSVNLKDDDSLEFLEFDPDNLPTWFQNTSVVAQWEQVMTAEYRKLEWILPTKYASDVLSECLLTHLKAVRIKEGFYFVPDSSLPDIERISGVIEQKNTADGGRLGICSLGTKLSDNPSAQKSLLQSVVTSVKQRIDDLNAGIESLSTRKMRADGAKSRLDECQALRDLISEYSEVLGPPLLSLNKMVDGVEEAISVATALKYSA